MSERTDEFFRMAREVRCIEDFKRLHDAILECNDLDYNEGTHATSALALAGAWIGARMNGITGFQASFVKFDFMRQWDGYGKETGCIKVIDYDKLIYPQYVKDYEGMHIGIDTWLSVKKACIGKLSALDTMDYDDGYASENCACYAVREYWGKVASGWIPDKLKVYNGKERIHSTTPMCVTRPVHTVSDLDTMWEDHTSPLYDEERARRQFLEHQKASSC